MQSLTRRIDRATFSRIRCSTNSGHFQAMNIYTNKETMMKLRNIFGNAIKVATLAAAGFVLTLPTQAQETVIHERKENQQDRIAQGVKSGQLTPKETARLEKKEVALNRETRNMRRRNDGKLTPRDKKI